MVAHEGEDGQKVTRRLNLTGRQGQNVPFEFAPLNFPLEAGAVVDATGAPELVPGTERWKMTRAVRVRLVAALAAGALAWLVVVPATGQGGPRHQAADLTSLLDQYLHGNASNAVASLATWSNEEIDTATADFNPTSQKAQAATVLLLTEAGVRDDAFGRPPERVSVRDANPGNAGNRSLDQAQYRYALQLAARLLQQTSVDEWPD